MDKKDYAQLWVFAVIMALLLAPQYLHGREKPMAELLFEEQFENNDFASRGWYDGVNSTGYHVVHDDTLGKNVLYEEWTTNGNKPSGDPAIADDVTSVMRMKYGHAGDPKLKTQTIYCAVMYHDVIWGNGRTQSNMHHMSVKSNTGLETNERYSTYGEQLYIEPSRNPHDDTDRYGLWARQDPAMPWGPGNRPHPSQDATMITTYRENRRERTLWSPEHVNNTFYDDVWYEMVIVVTSAESAAAADGRVTHYFRKFGDSEWILLYDEQNLPMDTPGYLRHFKIGSYMHNSRREGQRNYLGWLEVYSGDAMEAGLIPGSGGSTDPEPAPEPEPDPEPEPVALEIQNFEVSGGHTEVTISWDTNLPANAVLDYGLDENLGTVLRSGQFGVHHTFLLENLTPETTYYFRYSSRTEDGSDTVFDPAFSNFVTDAEPVVEPEPEGFMIVLDREPAAGEGVMFDGEKWVLIDLKAEVKRILETEVKLTVS